VILNPLNSRQKSSSSNSCGQMIFASDATTRSDRFVLHHKDELDAAEALANLAFNCRQRWHQTISS